MNTPPRRYVNTAPRGVKRRMRRLINDSDSDQEQKSSSSTLFEDFDEVKDTFTKVENKSIGPLDFHNFGYYYGDAKTSDDKEFIPDGDGIWTQDKPVIVSYNGDWVDGKMNGNAKIKYSDGSTYEGMVSNGLKTGFGKFENKHGIYKGNFIDDKKEGRFKVFLKDYDGNIVKLNNIGIETDDLKDYSYRFDGFFKDDSPTIGVIHDVSGQNKYTTYKGEVKIRDNEFPYFMKHGKGKYVYIINGDTYTLSGNFSLDQADDDVGATLSFIFNGVEKPIYIGKYKNGIQVDTDATENTYYTGNGILADTYKGGMINGSYEGYGVYTELDSQLQPKIIVEGYWRHGKQFGPGKITDITKDIITSGFFYSGPNYPDLFGKRFGKGKDTKISNPNIILQEGYFWNNKLIDSSSQPHNPTIINGNLIVYEPDNYNQMYNSGSPVFGVIIYDPDTLDNPYVYMGEILNGKREGLGVLTLHSGKLIDSEWVNDIPKDYNNRPNPFTQSQLYNTILEPKTISKADSEYYLSQKCFDVAMNEDIEIGEYIDYYVEENKNSEKKSYPFVFITHIGDSTFYECHELEQFKQGFGHRSYTKIQYPCIDKVDVREGDLRYPFYVIGNNNYLVPLSDINNMIELVKQGQTLFEFVEQNVIIERTGTSGGIFFDQTTAIDSLVSADHCQEGTSKKVYKIRQLIVSK